jgi:hypothetical protein
VQDLSAMKVLNPLKSHAYRTVFFFRVFLKKLMNVEGKMICVEQQA